MNGILKPSVEEVILFLLALVAALAVLANFGAAFWAVWLGVALFYLAVVKYCQYRLVPSVD